MIVSTAICAATHADNPFWVGHLIVTYTDSWRHLVRDGSGDDHYVRLARGRAEDNAQPILIVSRHRSVHHLYATASKTET